MKLKKYIGLWAIGMIAVACSVEDRSDAYGQFEADEVVISSETQGTLLQFQVEEGDRLDPGVSVGLVDTTQLALQKNEIQANRASVRTRLARLDAEKAVVRSQLETAEKELGRVASLGRENAATQQQIDRAEGEVNTLNRRVQAVEAEKQSVYAELERLQARIEQVTDQIRRAEIINPLRGTVLATYTEQHEQVSPGKPLYRISNLEEMELRVYVSGAQLPQVRIGEEVEVLIDRNESENERLTGTVSRVASRAEFTPRMIQTKEERVTQVYAVTVRVQNPDGRIKIGMPGEVNF
ncbi:MAG: HlyD family efflux transporter periplasmic adaptor subunit [Balneolaceae bacterium]